MKLHSMKSLFAVVLSVIAIAATAVTSNAQGIALDPAFGTAGTVRSILGCGGGVADVGGSVFIQPDGKIVVIGDSYSSGKYAGAVARFKSDGSIDSTFRSIGSVRTSISGGSYDEHTFGGVLQPDGKIVVVSSYDLNGAYICLVRYNSNGSKDNSFGSSGIVWNTISGNGFFKAFSTYGNAVALQSDGKIVVVGRSKTSSGYYQFAVCRFLSDGTLDAAFGTNGTARNFISGGSNYIDEAYSAAIQPDGKIVAGGVSYGGTYSNLRAFAVARYNSDGSIDSDFGSGGTTRNYITGSDETTDEAFGVAIQGDGKILLVGHSFGDGNGGMSITRYTTSGGLDNTFGVGGTVRQIISNATYPYDCGYCAGVMPSGNIVVAGTSQLSPSPSQIAVVAALFSSNGSYICSSTDFIIGGNGSYDQAYSLAFQPDGNVVVAGSSATSSNTGFAIARYMINDVPLAAEVVSSFAVANERGITLSWKTASEIDIAGYRVLRLDQGVSAYELVASYVNCDGLKGKGTSTSGSTYTFVDTKVKPGLSYSYKIESVSSGGIVKDVADLPGIKMDVPQSYRLYQNFPNPFNPSTTVRFDLKESSTVTLEVYNALGQRVVLENYGAMDAGRYDKVIDMRKLPSGVYYYRLNAIGKDGQAFVSVMKLVLMK